MWNAAGKTRNRTMAANSSGQPVRCRGASAQNPIPAFVIEHLILHFRRKLPRCDRVDESVLPAHSTARPRARPVNADLFAEQGTTCENPTWR